MEKGQACKVNVKRGRRDDGMRQHVAADHVRVQERLALFTRGGRITKQFRAWSGRTQGGQYLIEYLYRLHYSDYSDHSMYHYIHSFCMLYFYVPDVAYLFFIFFPFFAIRCCFVS